MIGSTRARFGAGEATHGERILGGGDWQLMPASASHGGDRARLRRGALRLAPPPFALDADDPAIGVGRAAGVTSGVGVCDFVFASECIAKESGRGSGHGS